MGFLRATTNYRDSSPAATCPDDVPNDTTACSAYRLPESRHRDERVLVVVVGVLFHGGHGGLEGGRSPVADPLLAVQRLDGHSQGRPRTDRHQSVQTGTHYCKLA